MAAALAATGASLWMGFSAAKNADLGYRADKISVITFDPGQSGYSEARTRGFYRELTERVKELPGVTGVALAQSVPLGMTGAQKQIRIRNEDEMTVWMNVVTPEYFSLMHMGLVAGRGFDDRDGAIVNEELAKRVSIGEKMRVNGRMVEVVGIVKTAKYMRWDEAPRPFFYLPYKQNYASRMTLHIESRAGVLEAVRKMARDVPASDARKMREYFDNGAMFGVKVALRVAAGGWRRRIAAGAGGALWRRIERGGAEAARDRDSGGAGGAARERVRDDRAAGDGARGSGHSAWIRSRGVCIENAAGVRARVGRIVVGRRGCGGAW